MKTQYGIPKPEVEEMSKKYASDNYNQHNNTIDYVASPAMLWNDRKNDYTNGCRGALKSISPLLNQLKEVLEKSLVHVPTLELKKEVYAALESLSKYKKPSNPELADN